jgi:hypothetical protein
MTSNQPPLPTTFGEFWPWYMAAHQDPRNRAAHYVGSTGGLVALAATILSGNLWLVPLGILWGYGCAWFGHFAFERNKPASWVRWWWSFLGDWKMYAHWLTGREREAVEIGRDMPDIVEAVRASR